METWIALFRGINVGGRVLLMKELVPLLEKAGCRAVQTYIQSGNAVFRASATDAEQLQKRIAVAVERSRGFEPRVIVLRVQELERAATGNPFPNADDNPKSLHLMFLTEAARNPDLKTLETLATPTEKFVLERKVFYLYTPDGFGTSKLAEKVEKCLGVACTARNWRTVNKLIEMARALES